MCLGVWFGLLRSYALTCKSLGRQHYIQLAMQPGSRNNAVKVHLLSYLICLCMFCSVQPGVSRDPGPVYLDCSFFGEWFFCLFGFFGFSFFPIIATSLLNGHKPFKGEKQSQYLATSPLDVLFFTEMKCCE